MEEFQASGSGGGTGKDIQLDNNVLFQLQSGQEMRTVMNFSSISLLVDERLFLLSCPPPPRPSDGMEEEKRRENRIGLNFGANRLPLYRDDTCRQSLSRMNLTLNGRLRMRMALVSLSVLSLSATPPTPARSGGLSAVLWPEPFSKQDPLPIRL